MSNEHKFLGFYRGKVLATDASEALHLGRIKSEIYPMMVGKDTALQLSRENPNSTIEGIAIAQLPWAVPAMPLMSGAGSGSGHFAVPDVGSYIWLFFEAGDFNQPVYFAEAPTATVGLPTARETNYPKRRVIATAGGISIIFDDETGHLIITGEGDVVVQGSNVRLNPLKAWV